MSTQDVLTKLLSHAPAIYKDSTLWSQMMNGEAPEINSWLSMLDDIGNQLFVDTATWGLEYYESEYGLTPDSADTYDTRRSRIKAAERGGGTFTPNRLNQVVLSYVESAKVAYDISNNAFSITILRPLGVPALDTNLKAAVERLKPAHLGFSVIYTYATWADKKNAGKTWADLKANGSWNQNATTI